MLLGSQLLLSPACGLLPQIREMEDVVRQSQAYSSTLQTYNTSLQNDLKEEKAKRDEASRERDHLQVWSRGYWRGYINCWQHDGHPSSRSSKPVLPCSFSGEDLSPVRVAPASLCVICTSRRGFHV